MAWRFKASKYKNAAPIVPKFENLIRDLSVGSFRSHGNFIAASGAFMAFNWDNIGSNLAVLPLDTKGRQSKTAMPLIYAHSEFVTDFQFSPFDDGLLATGSQDLTVKLWRIPPTGLPASGLSTPELTLPAQPRRVETVNFNPSADYILATSSNEFVSVWDLVQAEETFNFQDHGDEVQSVAWQWNGNLLATQCKDRQLRIIDPRQGAVAAQCDSHQGITDSKVVWIGNSDRVLTTGFSGNRLREINIRDLRNLATPEKNLTLDMSSGILVPLYDPDTNMCFLCGKGDRNIQFVEITDREPYIVEGLKYSGDQTKGACLVPKRAMDVMQGEVNRVLQLCDSSIVPVTWQVPRKTYRDYHSDIYPTTFGLTSAMGPGNWLNGENTPVPLIDLDPKKRPKETLTVFQEGLVKDQERTKEKPAGSENGNGAASEPKNGGGDELSNETNGHNSSESNGHTFAKPAPRPRVVSRSNSATSETSITSSSIVSSTSSNFQQKAAASQVPTAKPRSPTKLEPSPRPRPRSTTSAAPGGEGDHEPSNNGESSSRNGGSSDKDLDEGLSFLRRQPSIKDRKKMFEENMKKAQETTNGNSQPKKTDPTPLRSRTPSDEENKENKLITIPETSSSSSSEAKPQPSVELRNKNPFLANDRKMATEEPKPAPKRQSKMFGRVSKFKHLKGDVILKGRFENLKNLSKTCPAECDYVHANGDRIALPLTGPGGKIAVFETKKPGRIPDGVQPVLINGTSVMDFAFDPFDNSRLAVACDDGYVRIWKIPEGGLVQQVNEPHMMFAAHADKITIVKFHPLAKDVILTAAFDRTVKIWDLNQTDRPKIELEGHTDQLYSMRFSQCGRFLATVCRDGKIRIFDPRKSVTAVLEGGEIIPKKGARVVWAMEGQYLVVTGFSRQSERQVMVYRTEDLELLNTVVLDVSPAIMIPHYDADSNTLFLSGKGESTVTTFEVALDAPHLFPLSAYTPKSGLHQGFAFLQKNVCNVREVEFARAYRLTNTTIEPISFTVPRVKTAFFQDDLFPPTRVTWDPAVSADEWFQGSETPAARLNMKPEDMKELSSTNKSTAPIPSTASMIKGANPSSANVPANSFSKEMAKQKEADIGNSVSKMLDDVEDAKLEQDDMETGVEEEEWAEEVNN